MRPASFSVRSGSAVLAGERAGSGQPLVCLHAGVADRRMYSSQMHALGAHFDVLSYDRRGFGQTRAVDEPFAHVDDLAAVIEAAGIADPILLGCSQGGRIAVDYALACPGQVRALILISTAISGAPAAPLPDDLQVMADGLDAAEEAGDLERVNAIEAQMWLDGPRSAEGRVAGPIRDLFLDMNRLALEHAPLTQERAPPSAFGRLSDLGIATLLLHGTLDVPHIVARHARLAQVMPDACSIACEDTAHLPSFEDPAFVNAEIVSFCQDRGLLCGGRKSR